MAVKTKPELITQNDTDITQNINRQITGQILHDNLEDIIDSVALTQEIPLLSTNIYNYNGALTGDRMVNTNSHSLLFIHGNQNIRLYNDTLILGLTTGPNSSKFVISDVGEMLIEDSINTKGLIYDDDYSANYTLRSLVDKEYVDTQITDNTITASNGLTKTANDIRLGGTLMSNTTIDCTSNEYELYITSPPNDSKLTFDGYAFSAYDLNNSNDLSFTPETISFTNSGRHSLLRNVPDSIEVSTNSSVFKGLTYKDDYSANYTLRSLVDREYVDTQITDNTITASNGLTKTVNDIQLGGTLTDNITIDCTNDEYELSVTSPLNDGKLTFDGYAFFAYDLNNSNSLSFAPEAISFVNNGGRYSVLKNVPDSIEVSTNSSVFKGLTYKDDYSANFTNKSLVDKEYVDNKFNGWTGTFTNGDGDTVTVDGGLIINVT